MRYLTVPSFAASPSPDRAQVSAIGLGTWQFGSREWGYGAGYDGAEAVAIVRRAVELGVTLFDTAEVYGFGRSERILGAALRDAEIDRNRVFLATKIMPVLPLAPVVQQRALASAARLSVRHLDLYQVHQPNPLVKDGTTMRGMRSLLDVGLVRHVGVSNYPLSRWQAADDALDAAPVVSNQVQYSLVHRAPEADLLPFAEANGRFLIAWSPLAQGFLSARHSPQERPRNGVRSMNPLFLPQNLEQAAELFDVLRQVARAHDATPAQIALAWVIRHPNVAAIPGASSVAQLESNVAAAGIVLAADEVSALSGAAQRFRPVTGRSAVVPMVRARRRAG